MIYFWNTQDIAQNCITLSRKATFNHENILPRVNSLFLPFFKFLYLFIIIRYIVCPSVIFQTFDLKKKTWSEMKSVALIETVTAVQTFRLFAYKSPSVSEVRYLFIRGRVEKCDRVDHWEKCLVPPGNLRALLVPVAGIKTLKLSLPPVNCVRRFFLRSSAKAFKSWNRVTHVVWVRLFRTIVNLAHKRERKFVGIVLFLQQRRKNF